MEKKDSGFGVGIGFHSEMEKSIFEHKAEIDFIEISPESYMPMYGASHKKRTELDALKKEFRLMVHSTNLSIASPSLDKTYLENIKTVCDQSNALYYSDHLAITRLEDVSLGHLSPTRYCPEILERIIKNIKTVQNIIERPFLLENIAYHFLLNDSPFDEVTFFNTLTSETGCGILLDLANLHANSHNFNFNPYEYIDRLNLDPVMHVHIAGGDYDSSGYLYDSHSNITELATWELLMYLTQHTEICTASLEHDSNTPSFDKLLKQIKLAKGILEAAREEKC